MPYIYENDPTKIGANLQTAVGYLLSLHKNEYEWNLLGIKVIGAKEALPIPDGTYEYGDAYMIGTEADGYQLWIYTRADEVHSEAYWFNVGAFPKPGPQGPKGDGVEQINKWVNGTVSNVTYNTTEGAKVTQATVIDYTDTTDGSTKYQQFNTTSTLPILPGKYMSIDANSDNTAMTVKVDDTSLALDFISIDKSNSNWIPWYYNGALIRRSASNALSANSVVLRDQNGVSDFYTVRTTNITGRDGDAYLAVNVNELYRSSNTNGTDQVVTKTSTDTGTMSAGLLGVFQSTPNSHIVYDGQLYYRMDPTNAPNGTLNFVHLDSIDDGTGNYKATGKCFSITVSTREWQVVDLDFGGSNRTTHNLTLTNSSTGMYIYFSLTNNRTETYEGAPAGLWSALENNPIACTVDANGTYSAGMITADGDNFGVMYGNGEQALIEQMQVSITDNMV